MIQLLPCESGSVGLTLRNLTIGSFYQTNSEWKQEKLEKIQQKISQILEINDWLLGYFYRKDVKKSETELKLRFDPENKNLGEIREFIQSKNYIQTHVLPEKYFQYQNSSISREEFLKAFFSHIDRQVTGL